MSAEIIEPLFPPDLVAAVRHHHERYDGARLPGWAEPARRSPSWRARMCVVDSYDAMSLQRPYRDARTYEECLAELQRVPRHAVRSRHDRRVPARARPARRAARGGAPRRRRGGGAHRPERHATLRDSRGRSTVPSTPRIQEVLREVRDAYPEVRFMTTSASWDGRYVIVVDAEEADAPDRSPLGEEVMADDAIAQVLSGRPIALQRALRRQLRGVGQRPRAAGRRGRRDPGRRGGRRARPELERSRGLRAHDHGDPGVDAAGGGRPPEPRRDRGDHRRSDRVSTTIAICTNV